MVSNENKVEPTTVQVNVDELRTSKDQVLMRLMTLQSYIADLSKAYVEHVNSVINGGPATIEIPAMPAGLTAAHFDRASSPGAKSEAGGKKRKRAPADPNAPKRPLTPYFLYMQHNRSTIASELGGNAKPKDVSDEGTKRWLGMPDSQRETWKSLYQENYDKYKVDVAAYKAGKQVDEEDPAATQLQQDIAAEQSKSDSSDSEKEDDEEEEESSSPSPPPKEKTPTPRSTKRRRSDSKATKEVPDSAAKPASAAKTASPVKKATRGGKKAAEPKAEPVKETPAGKGKGKKRKSEA